MEIVAINFGFTLTFKDFIRWHRKCFQDNFLHFGFSNNNREKSADFTEAEFSLIKFNCLLCIYNEVTN